MTTPRYSLRQLYAFVALAEVLSFSAAADRLALSASAVSQLIAELEAVVGFRLFDRSTRKVVLSAAGREFKSAADSVLKHLKLAELAAADIRNRAVGIVRVAAPQIIASAILPLAIQAFSAERPRVLVRIRDAAVEQLVNMVMDGEVDLAVGPDQPVTEEVRCTSLFHSPWVLWCAREHALATRRSLRWRELKDHALVAAGHDHERSVAQMHASLSEEERVTPIDVVSNISTALGIAATGSAATLAPAYVGIWAERFGLVMRRVVDPERMRHVCLYQPAARVMSPAAEGFGAYLREWVPQWHSRVSARTPGRKSPERGARSGS